MKATIINLIKEMWPMLLIFCVVISSLRVVYLIKTKGKFRLYREILYIGFIVYIMLLFHVVTFQDVTWSTANFVPFKEIFRYSLWSHKFYQNVIGNMVMFLPYGFFVSYFLIVKKPYIILLLSLIVSSTIEFTQLIIGRVFDVDDILLNVLGAMVGYLIYKIIYKLNDLLPEFLKKDYFYNIIVSLAVITISLTFWAYVN